MENKYQRQGSELTRDVYTEGWFEKWFAEELALPIGLFHLTYDGQWRCRYAGDGCSEVLSCAPLEFLERFRTLSVRDACAGPEKTVEELLHEAVQGGELGSFIASLAAEDGTRYIKTTMAPAREEDGTLTVYGLLVDVSHSIDEEKARELRLRDQLRQQAEETERLFNMVAQHSNHIFYVYDLATRTTRLWDKGDGENDILAHLYTDEYDETAVGSNHAVLPDSVGAVKTFFADIHGGVPSGETNVHIRLANGAPKWYHFNYSDIFEGGRPVRALISIEDVTDKHEQEMSHLRFARTISEDVTEHMCYVEADLVSDLMEKHSGKHYLASRSFEGERYTDFWRDGFSGLIGAQDAATLYSAENLLRLFRSGVGELDNVWGLRRDGGQMWVRIQVELMEDSYSGHVKAFVVTTDVTTQQEERIAVILRADYDAMTGLLRRDTGEKRVKACMAEDSKPGVMVLLDLDDLKGINDTLGHDQGDVAIIGMANIIRDHFDKDDILMRTGGDEFVAFLPGAGEDEEALRNSLASLMEKFSTVSIGRNGERILRCSVGCAVEKKGTDTYEKLFKRADTALYHVKRGGKNGFAFFAREMAWEDHQFRGRRMAAVTDGNAESKEDRI